MSYLYQYYWSTPTFVLYLIVILLTFILSSIKKNKLKISVGSVSKTFDISLISISILLIFFKSFAFTGKDIVNGYYLNFNTATSLSAYRDQTVEIGFRVLNIIVKRIFNSYELFVVLMGLITIIPVVYLINKYSDRIDSRSAYLLYVSIYYFSGFSAARQYMALSICMLAFDAIIEKRYYKSIGLIALGSCIHIISILMIIPLIIGFFNYLNRKMIVLSSVIFFCVVYIMRGSLKHLFVGRYSIYTVSTDVSIGFRCFIYYIPIFTLLYVAMKTQKTKDVLFDRLSITITSMGFLFGMIEYIVSIIGRMESITISFIIILPYYIRQISNSEKRKRVITCLLLLYCVFRYVVFIVDNYDQQYLMPYRSILGFTI